MSEIPSGEIVNIPSFLKKTQALVLKIACEILMIISGKREEAQQGANTLQYRAEYCNFSGIPKALKEVKILFLTDPHIGGNIDKLAPEISKNIHILLGTSHPDKTIIVHGGDFVCSETGGMTTSEDHFLSVSEDLFHGLSRYPQFGVVGNHDYDNHTFPVIKKHLKYHHNIQLLETPEDVKDVQVDGVKLSIHGIHTLSTYLHDQPKIHRDLVLDRYIVSLNAGEGDCNIALIHNPDGLEFLLQRLVETSQSLEKPTFFLAGHTHGAMFDIPVLRHIGLIACKTRYGRYKGWYGPEGKYADTGNWKLYVSTGMGNSRDFPYRLNADTEVVLFTL